MATNSPAPAITVNGIGVLTAKWEHWERLAGKSSNTQGYLITLPFLQEQFKTQKEHFELPALRNLEAALTKGMDPLPKGVIQGRKRIEHKLCSFAQFLNLIWGPVIDFIEALGSGAAPPWTKSLGFNANKNHPLRNGWCCA